MSGGGSFGSNKSKQTSESAPWIGQQPFLSDVFGQAQNLYNQGVPGYYPGQTYTNFNPIQQQAMGATMQRAQGSPQEGQLASMLGQNMMQPQFNLGGVGSQASAAAGGVQPGQAMLSQAGGPGIGAASQFARAGSNPFMQQLLQQRGGQLDPTAQSALQETAGGGFLGGNPYLDEQFKRASQGVTEQFNEATMPGINAAFGSAGRTGSGIQQEMVGEAQQQLGGALGNLATDIYGGAYDTERDRQLQSAQQLGQLGLGATGLGQQASQTGLSSLLGQNQLGADIFGQGQNRTLQGGQALLSGGLGGIGALGDLYGQIGAQQLGAGQQVPDLSALQYGNIDAMAGVGEQVQGQSNLALEDDINRFNYYQQAPQALLDNYARIIQALGLTQGQSTGKSKGFDMGIG